jgi:hypothetical protein
MRNPLIVCLKDGSGSAHCFEIVQKGKKQPYNETSMKRQWLLSLRADYEKPAHSLLKRWQRFCSLLRDRSKR